MSHAAKSQLLVFPALVDSVDAYIIMAVPEVFPYYLLTEFYMTWELLKGTQFIEIVLKSP